MPREYDDDFEDDDDDFDTGSRRGRRRRGLSEPAHSGMGIASVVISLIFALAIVGEIAAAAVMVANRGGKIRDDAPEAIALGLGIICSLGFNVIGLALGIAGLVQSNRKKVFAVLGVIFNGVVIVGTGLLMVIGQMTKH